MRSKGMSLNEKAIFFRQFATVLKAGLTIRETLNIIKRQMKKRHMAEIAGEIVREISAGRSLNEAMAARNRAFSPMEVAVVRAGENGGCLTDTLDRLAGYLERQVAFRRKVVTAVTYPALVVAFSLVVLYVMTTVVIPKFSMAFFGLGVRMPFLTRLIFSLGNWMRAHWLAPLVVLCLVWVSMLCMRRNRSVHYALDRIKLKIPVFGSILFKAAIARSIQTLAALFQAGVPLLSALSMVGGIAGNDCLEAAFARVAVAVRNGSSLGESMGREPLFGVLVPQMVRVGEESGSMDEMMERVAEWTEAEMDEKIKRLSSAMEPLLIMVVGLVVGILAAAIYLPIVSAIQSLT